MVNNNGDSNDQSKPKGNNSSRSLNGMQILGLIISILLIIAGLLLFSSSSANQTSNSSNKTSKGSKETQNPTYADIVDKLEITIDGKAVDENNVKEIKILVKNSKNEIKKETEESVNKKIILANMFFKYIIALILVLSGIIGIFAIIIWYAKEKREDDEKTERIAIRKFELEKIKLATNRDSTVR